MREVLTETERAEAPRSVGQVLSHSSLARPTGGFEFAARDVPFVCAECSDVGYVIVRFGSGTAARVCRCQTEKRVARLIEQVPARFKGDRDGVWGPPDLATLVPRGDLSADPRRARFVAETQARAIEVMRRRPFDSYYFAGPRDSGKTHLAYALLFNAARACRAVWAGTVAEILDQYQREAAGEPGPDGKEFRADVRPSDLKRIGSQWTLLLDEAAYTRATQFRHEMLFDLLDAAWKFKHQLIVTCNVTLDQLAARWDGVTGGNGDALAKRLCGDAHRFGFFAGADEVTG